MKTLFYKREIFVLKVFLLIIISSTFSSCSDNDNPIDDSHFSIKGEPSELNTDYRSSTHSYEVKASGKWEVVIKDKDVDWIKINPKEGEYDGSFELEIEENTGENPRSAELAFFLEGQERPMYFFVNQGDNTPFIKIKDSDSGKNISSDEGEVVIEIESNVDWTYSMDENDWLTEKELKENQIVLIASKNLDTDRSATITVVSKEDSDVKETIKISQPDGKTILSEDFNWLEYGNAIFYEVAGEKRMDQWEPEELSRGWTSTKNPDSNDEQLVYARQGFVKLGKTNYGGDLISPKLSKLTEPTNVKVTFKAVPYQTKAGTRDDNTLYLSTVGEGEVSESSLTIDNWPDYDEDPDATQAWEDEAATYSFEIKGATSDTQIRWLGGALDLRGVDKGKNRIFIDDIKVEVVE